MATSKAGRPAGSRNKQKDKTMEDFGVNMESDMKKRLEILMRIFKEETVAELKKYNDRRMESMMENIRKEIQEDRAAREEKRNKWKEEKKEMLKRIKGLEMEQEKIERERRKKNLVIRGVNVEKQT